MMFIALGGSRRMMNDKKSLMVCVVLISATTVVPIIALAQNGDELLIESNMSWEQDMSLSQNVRIINGGSLTISNSEVTLAKGVDIFVEEGSALNVENSEMIAAEPPTGLKGFGPTYTEENNRSKIMISADGYPNGFSVKLKSIDQYSLYGVTAYFNNQTENLSGSEYSLAFESGTGDVWIGLVGWSVAIGGVDITPLEGGDSVSHLAADLPHRNMMAHGDPGFTISVDGTMEVIGSSIMGAQISASGQLRINDTVMNRAGPVILLSDDAAIVLGGTTNFTDSVDDHDVRARAHSSIEWGEDVSGSGGLTDKWERRIVGQHLRFEASWVTYEITGMHNYPSYNGFSDETGVSYIVLNGREDRIVEIAWSDDKTWEEDSPWREQAVVTIQSYRTAWNPENSEIGNYGGEEFPLAWQTEIIVDQATPNIQWTSLQGVRDGNSTYTATLGESLAMEAEIANTGTAAAILAIDCNVTSTGIAAEMSPTWPNTMIGAGGEETIHFSWRTSTTGEDSLTCRVLTPTQLVDDLSFGGGEITSGAITWKEAGEEERLPYILPIMLALVVGIAIAGFVVVNRMNEIDEKGRSPE
ncbi:MAG: hypothetical protein VX652_03535 [Candidatus Thermoplasmatota archaeon]|nr:hypothetical protein [Candidatus Thermoplasmatota archaeon]